MRCKKPVMAMLKAPIFGGGGGLRAESGCVAAAGVPFTTIFWKSPGTTTSVRSAWQCLRMCR
ncbi:hypothetical protein QYF61_007867 [Mycteria americana]|uniref:Uncharacterized protein n=1 Tax=Mycteria americana TaxID=33587 RepID=A0AAN7RXN7_MYCAM|nr:hypothetical protein QYF61_007867 [Mycteria americana]